jgi:hypothetical protein
MKKTIRWKELRSINTIEGYVGGVKRFSIQGGLCVVDMSTKFPYKSYRITSKENGKEIASDLLNGWNLEEHEANRKKWDDEHKKTAKLIKDADALLASLKDGTYVPKGLNHAEIIQFEADLNAIEPLSIERHKEIGFKLLAEVKRLKYGKE